LSRNDSDRSGAHDNQDVPSEVLRKLEFVTPTEIVDLPSKGRYPEGHPLHGKDTIEVKYMTAKDEDILTSKSLIKKGLAIERFLQSVLLNKSIKTESMYICDRNAVLVAARASGYGTEYHTKVNCPHCNTVNEMLFDLSNPEIKDYDINPDWNIEESGCEFILTPPLTGLKVGIRLLNGRDENRLAKILTDKKNKEEKAVSEMLRTMITSVEGDSSRKTIDYYVDNMPTQDSRYLRTTYSSLVPSIKISEDFECHSCGYEQEMEVPFGADFFWPDR
tara:strand:- start:199 stop:1026 length:828 start_codon:yes stop_codon:yes gene_type:complete